METEEFAATFEVMLDDTAAIIHNQKVLADIHDELDKNQLRPFEQDYIYKEHFGSMPSDPIAIEHNGVTITTRVLHQTGIQMRDITGADLLYEIEGEKFGLIQYKRENRHVIKGDYGQLNTLLNNCPDVCKNKKSRPIPQNWLPLKLNSYCGSWYATISKGEKRFLHACEAESIFWNSSTANISTFDSGLSKDTFLELFSNCRIGALVRKPKDENIRQLYLGSLVENQHLVFEVVQKGKWITRR